MSAVWLPPRDDERSPTAAELAEGRELRVRTMSHHLPVDLDEVRRVFDEARTHLGPDATDDDVEALASAAFAVGGSVSAASVVLDGVKRYAGAFERPDFTLRLAGRTYRAWAKSDGPGYAVAVDPWATS